MSGIEFVGMALGVLPAIASLLDHGVSLRKAAKRLLVQDFLYDIKTYGAFGLVTVLLVPEVNRVIQRIRVHLLDRGVDQVEVFKRSFTEGFAMVGIAGAIIAQIAFTGLSLKNINDTHWTAYAAFVVSLVAGCLTVYFSCTIQLILSSFHGSQELLCWITRPSGEDLSGSRVPLLYAAILLVLPSQLLNLSLGAFLVGLGIYLGFLYTNNLGEVARSRSALAVLIIYILFTAIFLSMYGIPWGMKHIETLLTETKTAKLELIHLRRENGEIEAPHQTSSHGRMTADEFFDRTSRNQATAILQAIVRNQDEQMGLQKALLVALSNEEQ